jgi:uncharacterized protein
MITESSAVCDCCGLARGYIAAKSIFSDMRHWDICPWCISSGEAAAKFDNTLTDPRPLEKAELPQKIIDEVCKRTPSYLSFQQEIWRSHCNDACAYHGRAEKDDLSSASRETRDDWNSFNGYDDRIWDIESEAYPYGRGVFDKFVCLHCGMMLLNFDGS